MRLALPLILAILSVPAIAADCPLCGKWRSNAQKTQADIDARVPTYPAALRKMFGTLTIEYTATSIRGYSHDDPKADSVAWSAYELITRPKGQAQILRTRNPDGTWKEITIEFRDDCYRVFIPTRQGPGFHDYFCRSE